MIYNIYEKGYGMIQANHICRPAGDILLEKEKLGTFSKDMLPRRLLYLFLACLITVQCIELYCRDPDLGGQIPPDIAQQSRRFLVIAGAGSGIGNSLIFYPAAYYFAALTGR